MQKYPGIIALVTKDHIGSMIFANYLVNEGVNIQAIVESQTLLAKDNNLANYINRLRLMGLTQNVQWLMATLYTRYRIISSIVLSFFGRRQKLLTISQISKKLNIPIIRTKDINSKETGARIESFEPDILVSACFNQIIKKDICDIPKLNCVNVHLALSEKYRGLNSYFWVLVNNEKESGVTLHEVDEGIDTGKVIAQRTVKIEESDTAIGLFIKLAQAGAELFLSSLNDIAQGKFRVNDTSGSKYYSTFTKEGYGELVKTGRKFFIPADINDLF